MAQGMHGLRKSPYMGELSDVTLSELGSDETWDGVFLSGEPGGVVASGATCRRPARTEGSRHFSSWQAARRAASE